MRHLGHASRTFLPLNACVFQGTLARPIIQPEHGSLVPQNIRQRYLNALIEECKKFCSEREAFNIVSGADFPCISFSVIK